MILAILGFAMNISYAMDCRIPVEFIVTDKPYFGLNTYKHSHEMIKDMERIEKSMRREITLWDSDRLLISINDWIQDERRTRGYTPGSSPKDTVENVMELIDDHMVKRSRTTKYTSQLELAMNTVAMYPHLSLMIKRRDMNISEMNEYFKLWRNNIYVYLRLDKLSGYIDAK